MGTLWKKACTTNAGWVDLAALCDLPPIRSLVRPQLRVMAELLLHSESLCVGPGNDGEFFIRPSDYIEEVLAEADVSEEECTAGSGSDDSDAPDGTTPLPYPISDTDLSDVDDDDEEEEEGSVALQASGHFGQWLPKPAAAPGLVTVMSYNVLANMYATSEKFPFANPESLMWKHRFPKILDQIDAFNPSILCAQEMQIAVGDSVPTMSRHFHHLKKALAARGYAGLAMKKNGKDELDIGNAIFWNGDQFDLLDKKRVDFSDELCLILMACFISFSLSL
jgi:hypothetical protein